MKQKTLTAIIGLALLSGCAPKVAEWTPAEAPKKNIVQRSTHEHVVRYPAHRKKMCRLERGRLKEFIHDQLHHPDATHIYLTEFGGHSQQRVDDVVKQLRLGGVRHGSITIDTSGDTHPGYTGSGIILMAERFLVVPPSCDAWTMEMGHSEGHLPMSNMGCSSVVNLGMMVSDPRDLIGGKETGSYDGTRHALSVQMYREDKVKELKTENTSSTGSGGGSGA